MQTKFPGAAIVYKKIQGGKQSDITLTLRGKVLSQDIVLELREQNSGSKKCFPFRVETKHGSKIWSSARKQVVVKSSKGNWWCKRIRAQFCREYYGVPLQFVVRVGNLIAKTIIPIVVLKPGAQWQSKHIYDILA